jgi:hypothetical protein
MNFAEKIYGEKITEGKLFYYVKFHRKPESENAWVAADQISNLPELLEKGRSTGNEEITTVRFRKGSFSSGDEVNKIVQIVWNEEKSQSMGEVEWKSLNLYNSLYPLQHLHEKCPKEMCEMYYSLLNFTYAP